MNNKLDKALNNSLWRIHNIGDLYLLINKGGGIDKGWKIAYYPIFEDGKTNELYNEPRALIEKPITGGTDFRETPLRYLQKQPKNG